MATTLLDINFGEIIQNLIESMGFMNGTWQNYVMLLISFVLMYLAIVKKYEPLLLLPIAFGMFLINIPGAEGVVWGDSASFEEVSAESRGLLWYFYSGVEHVIYPPIIFLGNGAMTDFGQ